MHAVTAAREQLLVALDGLDAVMCGAVGIGRGDCSPSHAYAQAHAAHSLQGYMMEHAQAHALDCRHHWAEEADGEAGADTHGETAKWCDRRSGRSGRSGRPRADCHTRTTERNVPAPSLAAHDLEDEQNPHKGDEHRPHQAHSSATPAVPVTLPAADGECCYGLFDCSNPLGLPGSDDAPAPRECGPSGAGSEPRLNTTGTVDEDGCCLGIFECGDK
ncbi:hypothetical protein A1Q1_04196 [Trichosporon asahii var. asahii CBS 2479]|uniref:Uncharacterized protein n=1 Tax=Trichosporon asahii var. asahii (strain ATCC 90039 / CBS 2479 / JCM 2466 / KCTC 7840 / NBRC 103889/ NCYC 2677 / UAMH 7654) TaxID=1186058 RepID=J5QEJ5_TRIAS|nr:hypothetical protein A1Q1_04196 [Trichosporon asahii var. asahii CBS 2479]EJT46953.1 hypothetical protein A1Q1_04196 [Trichosporon asahii var. asahii CBS 2479]